MNSPRKWLKRKGLQSVIFTSSALVTIFLAISFLTRFVIGLFSEEPFRINDLQLVSGSLTNRPNFDKRAMERKILTIFQNYANILRFIHEKQVGMKTTADWIRWNIRRFPS